MTSGIYKITNDRTGEVYVGQSKNIEKRWGEHKEELKNGTHINKGLQDDYNNGDTFTYEILEEVNNKEEREDKEIIYIKRENSFLRGYNLTLGGDYDKNRGEMGYGGRLHTNEEPPYNEVIFNEPKTSYDTKEHEKYKMDHTRNPRYYGDKTTENHNYPPIYSHNHTSKKSNDDFLCCLVPIILFLLLFVWYWICLVR